MNVYTVFRKDGQKKAVGFLFDVDYPKRSNILLNDIDRTIVTKLANSEKDSKYQNEFVYMIENY